MRILIVSNLYPPHFIGGYELGCSEVAQALEARGHHVTVLTSCHGVGRPTSDGNVHRWLYHASLDSGDRSRAPRWSALARLEVANQRAFDRIWLREPPDVVYIWNLAKIPISLALRAEARGAVCYYVSDQWLAQWSEPGWYEDAWYRLNTAAPARMPTRIARALMRSAFTLARLTWTRDTLQLRHVQFCSAFLKNATLQAGRRVADGEIVHWGVDAHAFRPASATHANESRCSRLLYVGQLTPRKGVHTAVEALSHLHRAGLCHLTLTIAGPCYGTAYETRLREQVASSGLGDSVRFVGAQSRDRLPAIYREHGILLFPSCWDEPFAITPLEAMASGLAVVGTTAGGSREIFEHEVNALIFPEEDSRACADRIHRLATDPEFAAALGQRARSTILERFTLERMVDRIECHLNTVR